MTRTGKPNKSRRYNICKICQTDINQTGETYKDHLANRHNKRFGKKSATGSTLNYYYTRQDLIGIAL